MTISVTGYGSRQSTEIRKSLCLIFLKQNQGILLRPQKRFIVIKNLAIDLELPVMKK